MIKQAYFRGLTKRAGTLGDMIKNFRRDMRHNEQLGQTRKTFWGGLEPQELSAAFIAHHPYYKRVPLADAFQGRKLPSQLRDIQAGDSASRFFSGVYDTSVRTKLKNYYKNIGRQNADFFLKQGFRPPKDYKYETPFPFPNHPKKKQMMELNNNQTNNNKGQQYSGHA